MTRSKRETIRRSHDALRRGDLRAVRDIVTDDIEWETSGSIAGMQRAYYGKAGTDEWMHLLRSVWPAYDLALDEIVGEANHVLVVVERVGEWVRGESGEIGIPAFAVYWFEDGSVRRRRTFTSREEALAAAGLSE